MWTTGGKSSAYLGWPRDIGGTTQKGSVASNMPTAEV